MAAHAKPVPAFSSTVNQLGVAVDATASTASDGATLSYDWNWGDSTGHGTGSTATHPYSTANIYTVTLTVTDSLGASDTVAHDVTVVAPASNAVATDTFQRAAGAGWGMADLGGAWSGGTSGYSTTGTAGAITSTKSQTRTTYLAGSSSTDTDSTIDVALDKVADGAGVHFNYSVRHTAAGEYRIKVRVSSTGVVNLSIAKYVGTTETLLSNKAIAGYTYTAGSVMHLRVQAVGTGTTALKAKIWADAAAEPAAWTLTSSDTQAVLQTAGTVGVVTYVSGSTTNGPVVYTVDNLKVTKP